MSLSLIIKLLFSTTKSNAVVLTFESLSHHVSFPNMLIKNTDILVTSLLFQIFSLLAKWNPSRRTPAAMECISNYKFTEFMSPG